MILRFQVKVDCRMVAVNNICTAGDSLEAKVI